MTASQKKELENLISIHAAQAAQDFSFLSKRQRLAAVKQILRNFFEQSSSLRTEIQSAQAEIESAKQRFPEGKHAIGN